MRDGMDMAASKAVYRFSGFVLDLARGALLDAQGREVPLRAKSFELLCLFVTNAGRLLDRDAINKAIWDDVTVTDGSIAQCVRDIRRALCDERQEMLKTVPRRGYIFATAVSSGYEQQPTGVTAEFLPLPDKPSIAVLAFTNMSGDPEQEYFSDGIADDIITELSRSRSLFVIARNSSFTYEGHAVDARQVARELGVRYVLEGSVRRSDSRIRATAQLIDAETGNHIWAERYDRALEAVFAVQDEITKAVVTAILPAVADAELRHALRKPPESLGAWEAYQRGLWHMGKASAEDNERAKQFFKRAMAVDKEFVPAYTAMAVVCNQEASVFGTFPFHEGVRLSKDWACRAVEMKENDAEAQAVLAWATFLEGISDEVWDRVSLALEISPNLARAYFVMGVALVLSGQPSHGRSKLLTALRLNPRDPVNAVVLNTIAWSYFCERDYMRALDAARRVVSRFPKRPSAYRCVAASLGQLGRFDEAHDALQKAIEVSPEAFDLYVQNRLPFHSPEHYEHLLEGLRKAGWKG
jgi:adenylate cyclase